MLLRVLFISVPKIVTVQSHFLDNKLRAVFALDFSKY